MLNINPDKEYRVSHIVELLRLNRGTVLRKLQTGVIAGKKGMVEITVRAPNTYLKKVKTRGWVVKGSDLIAYLEKVNA